MLWRLFHKCRIGDYLRDDDSWALVTGSTDGIGECLADELLIRGFNVIIHGRNPAKIETARSKLERKHPQRKVAAVQADLNDPSSVSKIIDGMRGKKVTVLINNAAATDSTSGGMNQAFGHDPSGSGKQGATRMITVGVTTLTQLIHDATPLLEEDGPSLIMNVGSAAGANYIPYVSVYGATKAYMLHLTRTLAIEARLCDPPSKIAYMYVEVHRTYTPKVPPLEQPTSSGGTGFLASLSRSITAAMTPTPTAPIMARAMIDCVGCSSVYVVPYMPHEISRTLINLMPEWMKERVFIRAIEAQQKLTAQAATKGSRQD